VIAIGCTGGIGAGKSTVTGLLAEFGAETVIADAIARRLLSEPGEVLDAVIDRFGPSVLDGTGAIDRRALAAQVFADGRARSDLEDIVHPMVAVEILAALDRHRDTSTVVVVELPLLVETDARRRYGLDGVLVVDVPEHLAIERLTALRQMTESDARARIAAQTDSGTRLRAADFVIVNVGTLDELAVMTAGAWGWMRGLEPQATTR